MQIGTMDQVADDTIGFRLGPKLSCDSANLIRFVVLGEHDRDFYR